MRLSPRLSLLVAPAAFAFVQACLGEDVTTGAAGTDNSPDGSAGGADGSATSSGGDGATTTPGDGDGGVDAGPPKCGYPGEACCASPAIPCRSGTTCSTSTSKCMVDEVRIAGRYYEVSSNQTRLRAAKWDGTTWSFDANDVMDPTAGFSGGWTARGFTSLGPNRYRATVVKSGEGKMRSNTNGTWTKCEVGQSCVGPLVPAPELSSVLDIGGDIWLAGPNVFYRCANSASNCPKVLDGLSGLTWGEGDLVGTSSSDIWYSALDRVLHFDGTKWTVTPNLQARTIWQVSKDDVWVADAQFQHWDGAQWAAPVGIDGVAAPGRVMAMGGSAKDDVWAVGYEFSAQAAFSAHYDGTKWSLVPMPAGAKEVGRVYAPSRLEAFAVSPTAIYRWNGTAWAALPLPPSVDGGAGDPDWRVIAGPARPRP